MRPDPDLPCDATPVRARVFEDTLDGYIPLELSIQYMLDRNRFQAAWIVLMHAPVMDIPGLAATAPVPLILSQSCSGLIDNMDIIATRHRDTAQLSGVGSWRWSAAMHETKFAPSHRLGEPVFIRGIGFERVAGPDVFSRSFGQLACADPSASSVAFLRAAPRYLGSQLHGLGWARAAVFSMGEQIDTGIYARSAFHAPSARFADVFTRDDAGRFEGIAASAPPALCDYILIDLTDADPMTEALVRRI
ncbi:MAG: hypothetical protein ABJM43_09320 [Paracoccaceae bacterium]